MTNNFYGFVERGKNYYSYSTDAPSQFGEILSIQLLGHAMGYDAVHAIRPRAVHHNLYITLVGESTLSRKSTSQDLGRDLYPLERTLPEESSPEQFVVDLSEQNELLQFLGEFSGLLKGVNRQGGYMSRFVELYNDLHGCPKRYLRKLRGKGGGNNTFEINNCYLSINSRIKNFYCR